MLSGAREFMRKAPHLMAFPALSIIVAACSGSLIGDGLGGVRHGRGAIMENEKSPILEIKDLRVTYETDIEVVEAVNGISFQIEKGKTLGLVGETGAGKTTTALSILRLLPETTGRIKGGEIRFEGEDLLHVDEEQMRVVRGTRNSMVFQDPMSSLNPVYTVGDQIGEAIRLHRPELSNDAVEPRLGERLQ